MKIFQFISKAITLLLSVLGANAAPMAAPTNGSGGLPPGEHEVILAGQPALIIVGTNYNEQIPSHLCYYLHGDEGGYKYRARSGSAVRRLIDENGWVFVSPRAPEASERPGIFPWDGRSGGSQTGNAQQVQDVLDHMFQKYNVYRHQVLGAGASGGSWFHDAVFFPRHGGTYPSYFNLCCGAAGMRPGYFTYSAAQILSQDALAIQYSELKYTIGTADFLYPNALLSEPSYRDLGFRVQTEYLADVSHCGFNLDSEIAEYWSEVSSARFQTEEIEVQLEIRQIVGGRDIVFSWTALSGWDLKLLHSVDLEDQSWRAIATPNEEDVSSGSFTLTDAISSDRKRGFFRMVGTR